MISTLTHLQQELETISAETAQSGVTSNGKRFWSPTLHKALWLRSDEKNQYTSAYTTLTVWWTRMIAMRPYSDAEYAEICTLVNPIVHAIWTNASSADSVFTLLRLHFRQCYGIEHPLYVMSTHKMGLGQQRRAECRKRRHDALMHDVENRGNVAVADRFQGEDVLDFIDMYIGSKNHLWERVFAVQLATGSRFIEVLIVSAYASVAGGDEDIRVTGVAKSDDEDQTGVRPLIGATAKQVICAVNWIRKQLGTLTNTRDSNCTLSHRYNSTANRNIKSTWAHHEYTAPVPVTTQTARCIYANMAWQMVGKPHDEAESCFLRRVLMHSHPQTAISYQRLCVNVLEV
jgi:hypothetical protein